MTTLLPPSPNRPAAAPDEEAGSSFLHALEVDEMERRFETAQRKEKKHLLWMVLGLSPAAAIPALGLFLEGSSGLLLLLLGLVAVTQAVSWNRAAREAERLEAELRRFRDEEGLPDSLNP